MELIKGLQLKNNQKEKDLSQLKESTKTKVKSLEKELLMLKYTNQTC